MKKIEKIFPGRRTPSLWRNIMPDLLNIHLLCYVQTKQNNNVFFGAFLQTLGKTKHKMLCFPQTLDL
ncbi:MAG: hypothetical protein E7320_06370 [Clostridiales bacterium]|nr:hypothetical protein [Clostridiales bacterium]